MNSGIKKKTGKFPREVKKSIVAAAKRFKKDPDRIWNAVKTILVVSFAIIITLEYFSSRQAPIIPAPTPALPAADTQNLETEIGQMLMVGFRGMDALPDSNIAKTITQTNLGGVILFNNDLPSKNDKRNISGFEQTKKLVGDLKKYATKEPLLVAVDAEGGKVNRLDPALGFADIPSAKDLGKKGVGAALESYWALAKQLHDLGFNINFGPVVDVDLNSENPVIGKLGRSYSSDPERVIALARAFIAAHRSFGIITALKHFPGHGSSESDSHLGLPDVTDTYQDKELTPYDKLIKDNAVDSVMSAHIIDRNIDPDFPATLSPKFIQDILRQRLGFDGVVFSDDMDMGAIVDNYGFEDSIINAINAGCDILVFSNNGKIYDETVAYRARDAIMKAVTDGRISRDRIEQAYARIMKLKGALK